MGGLRSGGRPLGRVEGGGGGGKEHSGHKTRLRLWERQGNQPPDPTRSLAGNYILPVRKILCCWPRHHHTLFLPFFPRHAYVQSTPYGGLQRRIPERKKHADYVDM